MFISIKRKVHTKLTVSKRISQEYDIQNNKYFEIKRSLLIKLLKLICMYWQFIVSSLFLSTTNIVRNIHKLCDVMRFTEKCLTFHVSNKIVQYLTSDQMIWPWHCIDLAICWITLSQCGKYFVDVPKGTENIWSRRKFVAWDFFSRPNKYVSWNNFGETKYENRWFSPE